jgi:enoyl-CoA hydratase/carnithine racemase
MTYETLICDAHDRVATITFNRAGQMNAFSKQLCSEVRDALRAADADAGVRVIVIRGAGTRAFSAGYDIVESAKAPKRGLVEWREKLEQDVAFTYAPWQCSKPVIAMIHGHCLGGGLEFAQMCDMRYASTSAKFGVVETRFAGGVATNIMPWILGARCRRLVYTGDVIGAQEALQLGLLDGVFTPDALEAETLKVAGRMSRVALEALQWNKRAINRTFEVMGFGPALQYGLEACTMLDSTETEEGRTFNELRRNKGLGEALQWQKSLFSPYE